jgi:hypothetical protein
LLDEKIAPVQLKYDKALELAGVKMVRSAPSSRVGARPAIEVSSWVGSQKSAGKTEIGQSEKSEVQMLKIQVLEMRKMMEEQAELIKTLIYK